MKERVGRRLSSTVPGLRIFKSSSPTFLTVATILSSDMDATWWAGVEREISRPPVRVVGLTKAEMVASQRDTRDKENMVTSEPQGSWIERWGVSASGHNTSSSLYFLEHGIRPQNCK